MTPLISIKMVKTFIDIRQVIMSHTREAPLTQPVYLFCGQNDLLTPAGLSVDVFSQVNFQDKKVKVYSEGGITRSPPAALRFRKGGHARGDPELAGSQDQNGFQLRLSNQTLSPVTSN
jgi:hypothetical protein